MSAYPPDWMVPNKYADRCDGCTEIVRGYGYYSVVGPVEYWGAAGRECRFTASDEHEVTEPVFA